MKRLLSILLLVACVFALASCGESELDNLVSLIDSADPSSVKTLTTVITADEVFHGTYLTTIDEDGSFCFDYSYERYADVEDALGSYKELVEGSVYYKDGKYSEDGENWTLAKPSVDNYSVILNLDVSNFDDYILSEDGNTLVATFSSEKSALVLGRQISATDVITMVVKTNGVYLTTITISYASELGEIRVDTSYAYPAIEE